MKKGDEYTVIGNTIPIHNFSIGSTVVYTGKNSISNRPIFKEIKGVQKGLEQVMSTDDICKKHTTNLRWYIIAAITLVLIFILGRILQ